MRFIIIGFLGALLLLSFPIINHSKPVSADPAKPCHNCYNINDVYDCFKDSDEGSIGCPNYKECVKCCEEEGWATITCRKYCKDYFYFPATSNAAKIVLTLFIVGSAIYLMRKRIGVAKS